jgi:hypothetical protein
MAGVNKYGKTFRFMKVIGGITRLMAGAALFIRMEMSMKESGEMIRHMVKACITTMMGPATMANGTRTFSKVSGFKNGQMDLLTKGSF